MKRTLMPALLEILLQNNELTSEQADESLKIQKKTKKLLGIILIEQGFITSEKLTQYLSLE